MAETGLWFIRCMYYPQVVAPLTERGRDGVFRAIRVPVAVGVARRLDVVHTWGRYRPGLPGSGWDRLGSLSDLPTIDKLFTSTDLTP